MHNITITIPQNGLSQNVLETMQGNFRCIFKYYLISYLNQFYLEKYGWKECDKILTINLSDNELSEK